MAIINSPTFSGDSYFNRIYSMEPTLQDLADEIEVLRCEIDNLVNLRYWETEVKLDLIFFDDLWYK